MKNKSSRRDFLRISATGALGAFILTNYSCKTATKPVAEVKPVDPKTFGLALQLYTIRDAMQVDVPGSLKQVSDMGYKYLELAGYADRKFYGMEPADFKKLVNDLGMEILSSHTNVEAEGITLDNAKIMAEDHAKLGVKYCVQPWVVPEARKVEIYKKMVQDWNTVGKIMKDTGIQFGYHNHNFEFANLDGVVPYYDIIMPGLDKDLVTMELDLFWTTKAGQNPIDLFNKYPGRFQLWHMKDMFTNEPPKFTTDGETDFAPVGAGLINFKEILAAKDKAGMKYMIVEQDSTKDGKPFDAIKTSITNLTTKILVDEKKG
jgi:sugar phosphate isomerase/epimerase